MKNVAVFVGSLRANSVNLAFAKALEKLAAGRLQFNYVELAQLPHYNDDLWPNPPAAVTGLKAAIEAADAVLFVTPEYNRSFPGILKEAIDWGSRPWGKNSWIGKPGSIIGTTPGTTGTTQAQAHLRSILVSQDVALLGQPEVYFQTKPGLIDGNHDVQDEATREFLLKYLAKFETWIDRINYQHHHAVAAE